MSIATSYAQLRKLTTDDLVRRYDELAPRTALGLDFYRHEIWRREQERQTQTMMRLTWVMTVFTAVNLMVVIVALAAA